ncbi:hypothetical protein DL98DRAFT_569391 [Cadophora sp. DSE1049]|nr:hypothetical protein DL98DRAFT_569391 [Cadophora sp. DSE1049]
MRQKHKFGPGTEHDGPKICVWFCHSCGVHGGMSTMIEHCPECQHERCADCMAQWAHSSGAFVISTEQVSAISSNDHSQKFTNLGDLASGIVTHRAYTRATGFEEQRSSIKPKRSCLPPTMLPALSPEAASTNPSSPEDAETETPRSSSCLSTTTPRSHESPSTHWGGGKFTAREDGYDDGDISEGSGGDYYEEDDEDNEESELLFRGYSPDTMRTLESRFLSLFSHDPSNVSELLASFQDLILSELEVNNATNSTSETPSSGAGTFDQGSIRSSSMTTTSNSKFSSSSPKLKRGRKKDDEDQKQRRTRQKQVSDREILHFACPFRKKDPDKYGRVTDERFSSCLAPKIPTLRRITCYSLFPDERGLIDHQQQLVSCSQESESLKEGINSDEWASIKDLLKAKKTKSESEKLEYEKGKCICFHEEVPSLTATGNELYMPPSRASVTVDHVLGSLERHLEEQIEGHNLERNSETHRGIRNFLATFRQYQESLTTPREDFSLQSPESQFQQNPELTPSNVDYQADSAVGHVQQSSTDSSVSRQRRLYSPTHPSASQELEFRSYSEDDRQIEQADHQLGNTESNTSNTNMFSDMVFDFESLPQHELFPADMTFNDYEMHFPDNLEDEDHSFQFNDQLAIPPLSEMLASENDGTPESFVEQKLKTKHHGSMLLPQP